jgi:hypothetical protein
MNATTSPNPLQTESLWFLKRLQTGLCTDPRFKEIVRELGLVDYWRTGRLHEHPVLHMGRELFLVGRTGLSCDRLVLYVVFELS